LPGKSIVEFKEIIIPIALTIAGSDSGAGAGIQADLKTFAASGVYGLSVVTAVTAQNTLGVQDIHVIPPGTIRAQIDSVMVDMGAQAIKSGMLANKATIDAVAEAVAKHEGIPYVLDPVMVAKSGDALLAEDAVESMRKRLVPLATVVTPNLDEASALADMAVVDIDSMKLAAEKIHAMGASAVVVTGGHLDGPPIDLLYDGHDHELFEGDRVESKNTHGTGCTFAAAIAAELSKGNSVSHAVTSAKKYLREAIEFAEPLGSGYGPVNHFYRMRRDAQSYQVIRDLSAAVRRLEEKPKAGLLVPEVQSNLAMGLPGANSPADVAAFPGRLVRFHDSIRTLADPEFGASSHIAKIVLTAMRYDPECRTVLNVFYSKEILAAVRELDLFIVSFNRKMEPHDVKEREGSSLEWGSEQAIQEHGRVPDIIYDLGDEGKEPMIRILGPTPGHVVDIALRIVDMVAGNPV
jgi:hydroxymethylpyrimidine kinase / phosphomethylpyrimidine kinase / thiamine-phosphate diphosphorylase